MTIRPGTAADAPAIERTALLTGLAGGDATGAFCDDAVISDVFAVPYLHGPATFCNVWDHDGTVLGYVLGTSDTREFQRWFSQQWWPEHRLGRSARTPEDEWLFPLADDPARMLNEHVDTYPAHLHIDLVPEAQGQGAGRALIDSAVTLLSSRGVPGLHLEAAAANTGANAFYPRVGFSELQRTEHSVIWGRLL